MRKLGILTLVLAASALLSADASAQRGRSSGGSSSRGSSSSSHSSHSFGGSSHSSSSSGSRGSSFGSSSSSRSSSGSSRGSSSYGSSSRSSSGYSSSRPSSSSSYSSGSRSYPSGSTSRGRDVSPRSSSTSSRSYETTPQRSGSVEVGESSSLGASDYADRFESRGSAARIETAPPLPGVDIDRTRTEHTRFPSPYHATGSARPAVPSRSSGSDLVGLVDRYRRAASASVAGTDRASLQPILDRYGASRRSVATRSPENFTPAPRRSGSRELNAERYTRGPELRRSLSGVGPTGRSAAANVSPSRVAVLRSASTNPRAAAIVAAAEPTVARADSLSRLAVRNPKAARRVYAAGNALAEGTALGLAAGVSVTAGPVAGSAVLGAVRPPATTKGSESCYWGYGYYPWWSDDCGSSWWFGFGWGWGGWCSGPSWCWGPLWTSWWYPYYCYSYHYCYPYYCQPSYYYPFYYSTVVHHVYDDDPVVVVVHDNAGDNVVNVDDSNQAPVGEAVAGARPVDSPLMQSLSIASERYLTLGDRAFRDGRYNDAAQFYAKAVEYAPEEGVLHLVLADALFATGDYHYAAYALRRAFELDPSLADAIVDKHEFYADPADFDRDLAAAELFVANHPDDSDARLVLAANLLFGNRPAAAVDLLESEAALSLRADTAASLILDAARSIQHGVPAPPETVDQQ